jgi:hypothetical protein
MALQSLPPKWCALVCAALRHGRQRAHFTETGGRRWQTEFPDAFRYELDDAFIRFLSGPAPLGCPVTLDYPPGETWDFYFPFRNQRLYGKLLLSIDHRTVLILSAHKPDKPKLRCE